MSTNPLERIPKRSPQTSVTDLNEFAKTAGSAAASAAYPIMLGLVGEDTGDEWYEDLAYGAVPGGALVQRAKTGTKPGLLDLLPGELGAGARLAMAPIAAAFSRDLLKGGAARLGKNARNTKKALTEKAQGGKPEIRYHRTHAGNVDDIMRDGLLIDPKHKGKNTADSDQLKDAVWLGLDPLEIPVLRWPMKHNPESVAEFKVTMPHDWYINQPRYHYPGGRAWGNQTLVPPGAPRTLTDEGTYKIDQVGADIPPEFLTPFDWKEYQKTHPSRNAYEILWSTVANKTGTGRQLAANEAFQPGKLPKYIRNNPTYADFIANFGQLHGKGDRTVYDYFSRNLPLSNRVDYTNRADFLKKMDEFNTEMSAYFPRLNVPMISQHKNKWGGDTRLFRNSGINSINKDFRRKPLTSPVQLLKGKLSDDPKPMSWYLPYGMPSSSENIQSTGVIPSLYEIATGHISRGLDQHYPKISDRIFDWDVYNSLVTTGSTPEFATAHAAPKFRLSTDDKELPNLIGGMFERLPRPIPAYGSISRGMKGRQRRNPSDRVFDWKTYNKLVSEGVAPSTATSVAVPKYMLNPSHDPRAPMYIDTYDITNSAGAISRGNVESRWDKRTLPGIYNISYRESIDNGLTDAEARRSALDAVKYWIKERSAE